VSAAGKEWILKVKNSGHDTKFKNILINLILQLHGRNTPVRKIYKDIKRNRFTDITICAALSGKLFNIISS